MCFCSFRRSFSFFVCVIFFLLIMLTELRNRKEIGALINNLIKNFLFHGLKQQFFFYLFRQCSMLIFFALVFIFICDSNHIPQYHTLHGPLFILFYKMRNSTSRCNALMNMYLKPRTALLCSLNHSALMCAWQGNHVFNTLNSESDVSRERKTGREKWRAKKGKTAIKSKEVCTLHFFEFVERNLISRIFEVHIN